MGAKLCKQICNRQGESGDAVGRRVLSEMVGQTVVEKSTGRVAKLIDTDQSDIPCKLCYFDSVGEISWLRDHEVFFLAAPEKYTLADMVGHTVLEKSSGRLAKLITTDSSDVPCKICYFDRVGDVCWCCEAELHFLSTTEEKELLAWAAEKDARQLREVATLQQSQPQARATAPSQAETIELPAINSWSDLEALFQQAQQAAHGIEATPPAQKAKAWDTVEKLWAHSLEFSECFTATVEASSSSTELPAINSRLDLEALFQKAQQAAHGIESTPPAQKAKAWDTVEKLWAHSLEFSECFTATVEVDSSSTDQVSSCKPLHLEIPLGERSQEPQRTLTPPPSQNSIGGVVSQLSGVGSRMHSAGSQMAAAASMLPGATSQKTGAGSHNNPDARHGEAPVRLTRPVLQMPGTASRKFAASPSPNLPGQVPGPGSIPARPGFASAQIPPSQRSAASQPLAASQSQSVKVFRASPSGGQPLQPQIGKPVASLPSLASGTPRGPPNHFAARPGY